MARDYTLPYGTSLETTLTLLRQVRDSPSATSEELAQRVKEFGRSRSALIEWGLLEATETGLKFTDLGRKVAWASDTEAAELIGRGVVTAYAPYEIPLTHHERDWSNVLDTEKVQQLWGAKLEIQLAKDKLATAAAVYFQVLEKAGLGDYFVGRGGKPTRIEFRPDALGKIRSWRTSGTGNAAPPAAQITNDRPESSSPPAPQPLTKETGLDSEWDFLTTPQFELRIRKTDQAWEMLLALAPVYRETLAKSVAKKALEPAP